MKKLLALVLIAGMASFVACGPSAKEKAEKHKQDSIKTADSIAKVQKTQDSLAAIEKAKQDSIAKADSVAKSKTKGHQPKPKGKPKHQVTSKGSATKGSTIGTTKKQ